MPVYLLFSHCPPFSEALAWGIWRASDIIKPMVCSAAAMVLPVGALTTMIPRWVAAFTSILSMPTPARPITINFLPASMTWAVTVEALRTINPS